MFVMDAQIVMAFDNLAAADLRYKTELARRGVSTQVEIVVGSGVYLDVIAPKSWSEFVSAEYALASSGYDFSNINVPGALGDGARLAWSKILEAVGFKDLMDLRKKVFPPGSTIGIQWPLALFNFLNQTFAATFKSFLAAIAAGNLKLAGQLLQTMLNAISGDAGLAGQLADLLGVSTTAIRAITSKLGTIGLAIMVGRLVWAVGRQYYDLFTTALDEREWSGAKVYTSS